MPAKSTYWANAKLADVTASTRYLALLTAVPTAASTGSTIVEATYTGYARKSIAAGDWATPAGGSVANVNAITFAACTGGSSTIVAWALCDAVSTGNVLYFGLFAFSQQFTVTNTQVPTVPVGVLTLVEQ